MASTHPVTALCMYVALLLCRLAYHHYIITPAYNAASTRPQGSDQAQLKPKRYSLIQVNKCIVFLTIKYLTFSGSLYKIIQTSKTSTNIGGQCTSCIFMRSVVTAPISTEMSYITVRKDPQTLCYVLNFFFYF